MDEGSSTESEGYETDPGQSAPVNSCPRVVQPAPPTFNILDLHPAVLTSPPVPIAATAKDTAATFVISRRHIPTPRSALASAGNESTRSSTDGISRPPPPGIPVRLCRHSLKPPTVTGRGTRQVERLSCTCCKRKDLDVANFSKKQRKEAKAATRKCRDCTYECPLTRDERRQQRERRRLEERNVGAAPQRVTAAQITRIPWQKRLQQIRKGAYNPASNDVQRRPRPELENKREELHPAVQQRASERREQLTPAQKKQAKRQKCMEEMDELNRNPPPPRTPRTPRAAAQKAQDEWRNDLQRRGNGFNHGLQHQRLDERESSRKRMLEAAVRVGRASEHSKRPHRSSYR
ncbi:hypothetical protein PHYPSEUDO_003364 [Phytophthora pseudosyringae]|uniref:Uncharacterized protein n=1 Tax=Phytophthora pseudosyringae TaxID=221518 RepID=A0A8T1VUP8_9STRA|nr:hypothetical protein PHYPSEUDO_003364 [Phytophthora pseudosyringae]